MSQLNAIRFLFGQPFIWILALGFLLRLYVSLTLGIVNPDAAHYIYQAKAIVYNDWSSIAQCRMSYVSLFPVLIAGAFFIVRDWIAAGQLVNLISGTGALIPIYYLTRRFLDHSLTLVTMLIFAVVPTYVSLSGDLMRDPVFWFFLCMGMLMFVRQWDPDAQSRRFRYDLFLSCIFLLLASLTRVEGVSLIVGSAVFIFISASDRKMERFGLFLSPLLLFGCLALMVILNSDTQLSEYLRLGTIRDAATQVIHQYEVVRATLKETIPHQLWPTSEFLRHARSIAWLVPFGVLFNAIVEGLFYIFALVYFLGFIDLRRRVGQDWRIGYFICLTVVGIVVLYLHMLRTWFMYHRFLSIVFFPGCIFFGFGLDHIVRILQSKFRLKANVAMTLIVVVFLLISVPKNLRPKETDKVIYRRAAAIIAESKSPKKIARVAAVQDTTYDWIFFYAHIDYPGILCGPELIVDIPGSYTELVDRLKDADARYVIYKEENWPKEKFDLLNSPYESDFRMAGQWYTDKQQTVILFERIRSVTGSENSSTAVRR